jgi:ATP-dependent 26S proteasome regulatory subunit
MAELNDTERFRRLLAGRHACVFVSTYEETDALRIVREAGVAAGVNDVLEWSVSCGLRDSLVAASPILLNTDHPAAALVALAGRNDRVVAILLDVVDHLKDARTLRVLRECVAQFARNGSTLVLIDQATDLPPALRAIATRFELSLPDEAAVELLLRDTLRTCGVDGRIKVDVNRQELQTIIRNLRGLTPRQARQIITDSVADDRCLNAHDIVGMLASKRKMLAGDQLLEFVESPVTLDEIGGLRRLKFWLEQRRDCLSDEAVKFGLVPPRGVLMLGVQGAGKSLAAKAVATAWQRPLLRLDVGSLYDKFIGESERRLREALRQAEHMAPIVLWIDEIEKAFASAASQSSDGGLSKRMFGTLLTWMQEHVAPVFLIATANDIEALPPELLRKGRFDEIFFVDLPEPDARRSIFSIHLKKRKRDPKQFDLDALSKASDGYSGAEIEQALLSAMHNAFARREDLTTDLIVESLKNSPPLSVTMAEKVAGLREWSEGRCVPAD